jgi:Tol biopolymer transport system component
MRSLVLVLALIVGAVPASAQYFGQNKVQYDDFDFQVLKTEHFDIYYYPEAEQAAHDAARMAERWYGRHTQTFLHRFDEKKPIILYANDADFQQTNVTKGSISPGTGGFTEPIRERVVMPLTGSYGSTDHVLGHELVHSFQFDLALNQQQGLDLRQIPLWLVEGMAEYLTVGRHDPHTAMWMRDAVLNDDIPTIKDLRNPNDYFPYRYGQALLAYVAGKYGDQAVTNLFKMSGRVGVDSSAVYLYGISADSLSNEWAHAMRSTYEPLVKDRTPADSAGRRVLAKDIDGGRINVAPTLSPDGRYVAFLSERDLFNITLFVADAETGEVLESLGSVATTPDLDAIRFISSAGTWDPSGRKLAFISFAKGDNEISIWNVDSGEVSQSFKVRGVTSMKNPAWSPDGTKIAFSGMDGGISDLYVLNLETRAVRQLTNDRYADLQPTWSPDGETLAFTTDRQSLGLSTLRSSQRMQLATIDVDSGEVAVREPFADAHHHNPQFSPDGRSLYFISDWDGFKDVYRQDLSSGRLYRVTTLQTGVSGITAMSPAMSVARQSGDMMFSVFSSNEYVGLSLDRSRTQGTPVSPVRSAAASTAPSDSTQTGLPDDTTGVAASGPPPAGVLPPYDAAGDGLVDSYLGDAESGLPSGGDFETEDSSSKLTLEGIYPPTVGASVGGPYGGGVSGGVGLRFGDMLGNRQLDFILQANGTFRDIGGGVSYVDRGDRFNYGASASHFGFPINQAFVQSGPASFSLITQRLYITQASLTGSYPLSTTQRFEVSLGGVRYGFGLNVRGPNDDAIEDALPPGPPNEVLGQMNLAYVKDVSDFGFTSPVRGARYRIQASPKVGTQTFVGVLADLRRYFHARPFTFAVQGVHMANYGADRDDLFADEYLGFTQSQGFVRGYSFNSFEDFGDCPVAGNERSACQNEFQRLVGTRVAKFSAEVRIPLLGAKPLSLLDFPYLPTQLALFTDAGIAWSEGDGLEFEPADLNDPSGAATPVISSGVSFRLNVMGSFILEPYWAYAFQRNNPSFFGLRFQPGW